MKSNMTDEELLSRGYREFKPGPFDGEYVEKMFQKRFDDDVGKKYFITVRKWAGYTHPYTGAEFPPSYECHTQMYTKEKEDAISFEFLSSWSLGDVERHVEQLWETGLYRHYEKWGQ